VGRRVVICAPPAVRRAEETFGSVGRVESWSNDPTHPELLMRVRPHATTPLAALFLAAAFAAAPLGAQATRTDSTSHFSLFGGISGVMSGAAGPESGRELGGSGDFRWSPIPVPLRFSLSFSQRDLAYMYRPQRGGKASLDLVMRPIPKRFGIRPYFLGGLGVATRAGYSAISDGYYYGPAGLEQGPAYTYSMSRETWTFAGAGMGLDIGRAFVQLRMETPVASSQGSTLIPLSVGFRFWD
jgi:hypothetical protein